MFLCVCVWVWTLWVCPIFSRHIPTRYRFLFLSSPIDYSCGALTDLCKYKEQDKVIKFLKGLNDQYSHVCSQILLIETLPNLDKTFSMVLVQEHQLALPTPSETSSKTPSITLQTQSSNNYGGGSTTIQPSANSVVSIETFVKSLSTPLMGKNPILCVIGIGATNHIKHFLHNFLTFHNIQPFRICQYFRESITLKCVFRGVKMDGLDRFGFVL